MCVIGNEINAFILSWIIFCIYLPSLSISLQRYMSVIPSLSNFSSTSYPLSFLYLSIYTSTYHYPHFAPTATLIPAPAISNSSFPILTRCHLSYHVYPYLTFIQPSTCPPMYMYSYASTFLVPVYRSIHPSIISSANIVFGFLITLSNYIHSIYLRTYICDVTTIYGPYTSQRIFRITLSRVTYVIYGVGMA